MAAIAANAGVLGSAALAAGPAIAIASSFAVHAPSGGAVQLMIGAVAAFVGCLALAVRASRYRERLSLAEGQLRAAQAAAEALPDGLAIFDPDDRIVWFNPRYPEHLAPSLRSVLAVGKRFRDWIAEGLAVGPIYHPEMGQEFLVRRFALHEGARADHVHRLIDGRWVRIRESSTPDNGRILLTTDVTEERRRDQERALLAMALEQVGDPVEITDAESRLIFVNRAFETTTGWARDEAIGREPQELLSSGIHPPAFFHEIKTCLLAGKTWHGLIVNRARDGRPLEQETTISPVRDEHDRITYFVAVKRDVTAALSQARALAESEIRYRAVVEAQTEFIVRIQPDGAWCLVNEACARYLGSSREALLAGAHRESYRIHPDDQSVRDAHLAAMTPASPTHTAEWRRLDSQGAVRWERWTDTGFFDAEGRLVEIQCVGREITEQKHAQLAHDEAERLRATALEAALDCYVGVDAKGTVIEWNGAAERAFGYSRAEAIGRPMDALIVPEEHRGAHASGMARHLATGESHILGRRMEMEALRAGGQIFPIEFVIVRASRDGGPIFLAHMRDLTDRKRAERQLAEREAQFRAVAENVPAALVVTDLDTGEPQFMNRIARRHMQVPPGEAITDAVPVWDEPEQRDAFYAKVRDEGAVEGLEVALTLPGGRRSRALVSGSRITWEGRPALLSVSVDVTPLRETERALRESEARLAAFMEFAPVAAHLRSADGRYLMLNPEMERIFGVSATEALGRTPAEMFPQAIIGRSDHHHEHVVATGERHVSEQHLTHLPEGPYRWVMAIRFPVFSADGRVSAVGAFAVDIAERKAAEAALRASEARLAAIIEANPVPMNITRLSDRKLLFANRPYVETFRLEGVDLDGFDRSNLYADPAERDWIFAEIGAGRDVTDFMLTLRRTDGTDIPASLTSRPILFQGEPAVVTSSVDLTALRAAQAEIARQREALHQSEKLTALGSLLAGVAHELNNPLSVVVGYSSMLAEMALEPSLQGRVERIHAAAERCARIVRTFLAMARARPPRRGSVSIAEVALGAIDLAGYGLRSAGVVVETDLPPDLPMVWGDADQLHQVVTNLVVNAQHALAEAPGPRRLLLRARTAGAEVALEVSDSGPGMAPEIAKRVFEPFFTTKPQGVGTGVGLSVCHGLIAAHGGRIDLETSPGEGATFRVTLPASPASVPEESAASSVAVARGRVLVVDDEADIAELVADALRAAGLEAETTTNGRQALAALAARPFDAVVSDLRMPDLDGARLLDAIATDHPRLADRVVLVTGDALGALALLGRREAPLFEKPLDLRALTAAVAGMTAGTRP